VREARDQQGGGSAKATQQAAQARVQRRRCLHPDARCDRFVSSNPHPSPLLHGLPVPDALAAAASAAGILKAARWPEH
jgi:hypothetical protein